MEGETGCTQAIFVAEIAITGRVGKGDEQRYECTRHERMHLSFRIFFYRILFIPTSQLLGAGNFSYDILRMLFSSPDSIRADISLRLRAFTCSNNRSTTRS